MSFWDKYCTIETSDIIELSNAFIALESENILNEIYWTIRSDEHWVITGANASGKTILARCLALKIRPGKGSLAFPFMKGMPDGTYPSDHIKMVSFTDTSKMFRSVNHLHYYQQRFNAFDADGHLTTRQYLESAGFNSKVKEHSDLLELLNLHSLLDTERIKLSSGQTRKMLLCKALMYEPRVLLIDNPYLGLDVATRKVFNTFLDQLVAHKNVTLILSGHVRSLPICIGHRLHLEERRIGRMDKLGSINIDKQEITYDKNILYEISKHFSKSISKNNESPVRMDHIHVQYSAQTILRDFNWEVKKGEKWALKGQNGSGKSTIVSLIYADHPQAYAQSVYIFGKRRGEDQRSIWDVKRRIGFTSPELHAYFYRDSSAMGVVLSGLDDKFELLSTPTSEQTELAKLLFQYYGLRHIVQSSYHTLSTGTQRLLFFMRALIKCPELLLLDEPFQGLDDQNIQLCRILLSHVLTEEHTLIFITHFDDEIPDIVDQVKEI